MSGTILGLSQVQLTQAAAQLGTLQNQFVSHLVSQGATVRATSLDSYRPTNGGSDWLSPYQQGHSDHTYFSELNIRCEESAGFYTSRQGGFISLDFIEDLLNNLAAALSLPFSLSNIHGKQWQFRLPPPCMLLSATHYAFGAEALDLALQAQLDPHANIRLMMGQNQRPFSMSTQAHSIHGQRDLAPYLVTVHDAVHHANLSRIGQHGRNTLLKFHDVFLEQAEAHGLTDSPLIKTWLELILDGPPTKEIDPYRNLNRAGYLLANALKRRGVPWETVSAFMQQSSLQLREQFPEQPEVWEPFVKGWLND